MKKFNDVFVVDDDKVYHFILKNILYLNIIYHAIDLAYFLHSSLTSKVS